MTTADDFSSTPLRERDNPLSGNGASMHEQAGEESTPENLRAAVERSMGRYLSQMGNDNSVTDLYQLVLNEVEGPLLEAVLDHTGSNQSKASIMLGLNRGTLRKKLKQHGLL